MTRWQWNIDQHPRHLSCITKPHGETQAGNPKWERHRMQKVWNILVIRSFSPKMRHIIKVSTCLLLCSLIWLHQNQMGHWAFLYKRQRESVCACVCVCVEGDYWLSAWGAWGLISCLWWWHGWWVSSSNCISIQRTLSAQCAALRSKHNRTTWRQLPLTKLGTLDTKLHWCKKNALGVIMINICVHWHHGLVGGKPHVSEW